MKKITQKLILFLTFGLFAFSLNAQTFYYEDFRYENTGRGFTVQKVALDGQAAGDVGKRVADVVDAADSSPVFDITSRPATRTPNGATREQRAISFKNVSGTDPAFVNHEIEAWALMTNQDLSSVNSPKVSFWTQQRSVVGSGSSITVWVSQNYTHGNLPSTATWTNETVNITGAIATAGVSPLTYVKGEIDLSAYTGTGVTVAFKIVTDNTAYSSGVSQHGTYYISDVTFDAERENVLPGAFSALNSSATGQTSIFNTPSASISDANFSNTTKWADVLTTTGSVPRLANGTLIPVDEGYKFEVADKYNPIAVSEVRYKLVNGTSNKGTVSGVAKQSTWKVQGSNDDSTWDDISAERGMFSSNSGTTEYTFPLTVTKAYRYYRFVLAEAWTPNQQYTALQQLDFTVASLWTGTTDSDWGKTTNWNTGAVPTTHGVIIPSGITNYPTIATGTTVSTSNITIESGASLIAEGTSTVGGNVTYKRNLTFSAGSLEGWHLVGSPVTGQAYDNNYATANTLATSGTKRGLATYNNGVASGNWSYLEDNDSNSGTFGKATGYSIKTSATADISFTGTLNTTDPETKSITIGAGTPYNLIANPFTAYINAKTFLELAANTGKLTSETIWVWNPSTKNYDAKLSGDASTFIIAPGQAFFVSCSTAGDLEFVESNQSHSGTDTFLKSSSRSEIQLNITDGELYRYAKVYYTSNATKSFDNGYDGETFGGVANLFDISTQLLDNNNGKSFQIQSLPNSDLETMVIPLGVKAVAGKEITFSAEALNLPLGIKVFLEDKLTNTFTRLDEANSNYKITLKEALDGVGRFYLHTKQSSVLSTNDSFLENVSIFKVTNSSLRITGLKQGTTSVKLFNILGKQVLTNTFNANGVKEITLPRLANGVYVVQLITESGKLNKKIILE